MEGGRQGERIVMSRQNGTFFLGTTAAGNLISIQLQPDQWEALGSPDEFILRVR